MSPALRASLGSLTASTARCKAAGVVTDPFAGWTADNASAQESTFGSTLYPAAEPEPQADLLVSPTP